MHGGSLARPPGSVGSTTQSLLSPVDRERSRQQPCHRLNRTCPLFPVAVFKVNVIAAPEAISYLASSFKAFSPKGAKTSVSRSVPLTISTEAPATSDHLALLFGKNRIQ
jgi:hypothetical protein